MARTSKNNTTTKKVKKAGKRGPYKKKKGFIAADGQIAQWEYKKTVPNLEVDKEIPLKKEVSIAELELLSIFCNTFDKYDNEAKARVWSYLEGKYGYWRSSK